MKRTLLLLIMAGASAAFAQAPPTNPPGQTAADKAAARSAENARQAEISKLKADRSAMEKAETKGVGVRIKDVARFRGVWTNQLIGIGVVTGLDGTGDSARFTATSRAMINLLRKAGLDAGLTGTETRNCALVTVTAELPPFAAPGQRMDVSVSTIGDSKSLRGGTLIFAPLKYPGNEERVFATAAGPISVGGFSTGAGGNSAARNFTTAGKIPGGAIVQDTVPTETVFNGKMYLDIDSQDVTTAHRMEDRINEFNPAFAARALNGGTIELTLPTGMSANQAQAKLEGLFVQVDIEAKIVVDEKTGTIIMGGNVRIAPCAIAKGGLSVRVDEDILISQPAPFSQGNTVTAGQKSLKVGEDRAEIAIVRPNTTVADLASIFQSLKLRADDIINILRTMHEQGALKARLVIQ